MFKTAVSAAISVVLMVGLLVSVEYSRNPDYDLFQRQTVRIEILNEENKGKPQGVERAALCSGVYLGDSKVLTAGHCIDTANESEHYAVYVKSLDSSEWIKSRVIKTAWEVEKDSKDRKRILLDLGLLELEKDLARIPPAQTRCNYPRLGEEVYSVGMPKGLPWVLTKGTLTTWVTRNGREGGQWLQLDMNITKGSSGGPVFDRWGNLLGIISNIHSERALAGAAIVRSGHAYAVSNKQICEFIGNDAEDWKWKNSLDIPSLA